MHQKHMLWLQKSMISMAIWWNCLERMVSQMVYCKIKERKDDFAVYNIGTRVDDMTGEITFYKGHQEPLLGKQAEKAPIRDIHIVKILRKYMRDFEKGIFNDKLAFEIG